jgi:hypothetical protein
VISKLVGLKILKKMDLDSPNENPTRISGISTSLNCHCCSVTINLFLVILQVNKNSYSLLQKPVIVYYHIDQREILRFPSEIKFGIIYFWYSKCKCSYYYTDLFILYAGIKGFNKGFVFSLSHAKWYLWLTFL